MCCVPILLIAFYNASVFGDKVGATKHTIGGGFNVVTATVPDMTENQS